MADRVEREIEEILRKVDDLAPNRMRRQRSRPRTERPLATAQGWLARSLARVSMQKVMMWALFVVVVAFFARSVPGMTWLMIGALIVFATAFLLSRRGGSHSASVQKRWRGEPIDLSGPSWPDRIKALIKGRRRA